MKRTVLTICLFICMILNISCDIDEDSQSELLVENQDTVNENDISEWKCGFHNGNQLWTGPRGGCYYYNSNNNKTYVDRSECSC